MSNPQVLLRYNSVGLMTASIVVVTDAKWEALEPQIDKDRWYTGPITIIGYGGEVVYYINLMSTQAPSTSVVVIKESVDSEIRTGSDLVGSHDEAEINSSVNRLLTLLAWS